MRGTRQAELHEVRILPDRSKQGVCGGRPWKGPLPPPRRSPPVKVGSAIERVRRAPSSWTERSKLGAAVTPEVFQISSEPVALLKSSSFQCSAGFEAFGLGPPVACVKPDRQYPLSWPGHGSKGAFVAPELVSLGCSASFCVKSYYA